MSLLHYLSYGGAVAAFIFVTLSLASGLLWLSELIEEHSRIAKVVGQRGIYFIMSLHVLLYFSDALPLHLVAFSIACHVVYLQNFTSSWPLVSLTSIGFLASCVLVIIDHFVWFFHFARITQDARHKARNPYRGPAASEKVPGFADIATFFGLCVWLAPLFLFLSLSANDNTLPMMNLTSEGSSPRMVTATQPAAPPGRSSLFRSLYNALPLDAIPRLRPKARRDVSQGIIAPPSPGPRPVSPLPSPSMPGLSRIPSMSALPPRRSSDSPRHLSTEVHTPDKLSSFSLGAPPKRNDASSVASPIRRTTVGGRIEMRRAASTNSTWEKDK